MMTGLRDLSMQRLRHFGAIAVLASSLAASCGTESSGPPQTQSQTPAATDGSGAANTTGPVLVGGVDRIDSLLTGQQGKWVLVNVWATWCRPCVAETPELVALHQSLLDRPFALVGVSADFMTSPTESEARSKVQAFASKYQMKYPNVIYSGSTDDLTARFALSGAIPATILYNPQGQEVERWVGRLNHEDFGRIKSLVS